jgi:hypothetical protein
MQTSADQTNTKPKPKKLMFALAGRLVTKSSVARSIWRDADKTKKDWLKPQALSVARQLAAAGQ